MQYGILFCQVIWGVHGESEIALPSVMLYALNE